MYFVMEEIAAITPTDQTVPIQEAHKFDTTALEAFMRENVEGFTSPLELSQFRGGMSNPTFMVTDGGGKRYVLRKKPPGDLLPSAHAVDREFKIISAIASTGVPVSKAYALCEDESVVGQIFYVMEFKNGRVFRGVDLPDLGAQERGEIYNNMADILAELHEIDYAAVGLGDFGRAGGYCERQVRRWSQQYEASKTEDLPVMDKLMAWLPENMPDDSLTCLAHGDYRLENIIFAHDSADVLAVVDWELGTLGNPYSDLAYNCLPYYAPDPRRGNLMENNSAVSGIPSEEDYVNRYCKARGLTEIPHWNFYLVLSLFRLAAIVQGVYYRGLQGNTPTSDALALGSQCLDRATVAWELVQSGQK
jgi:aminoglycoside phosphotransferase (APT) family kinase protein